MRPPPSPRGPEAHLLPPVRAPHLSGLCMKIPPPENGPLSPPDGLMLAAESCTFPVLCTHLSLRTLPCTQQMLRERSSRSDKEDLGTWCRGRRVGC